jgi:hypothetical protein
LGFGYRNSMHTHHNASSPAITEFSSVTLRRRIELLS